jgi:hypothetical protein
MSSTRAGLDLKLQQLQDRARDLTPRRYVQQHMPEYAMERAIGGALTVLGLAMAWRMYQERSRRKRVRAAMESYGRW